MALTLGLQASATSSVDGTTYSAVASNTMAKGQALVVACCMRGIASDVATTITGASGMAGTWNVVDHIYDSTNAIDSQLYVWVSTNYAGGTGTFTFTNTDGATSMCAIVSQFSGVNTSAPIVAGSVQKSSGTSVSTLTLPSGATNPSNTGNRPWAVFYNWNGTAAQVAPKSGWVEEAEIIAVTDNLTLESQHKTSWDATASATFTGGPYQCGGMSFEVAAYDEGQFLPFFS
jgi:hypothetical protein